MSRHPAPGVVQAHPREPAPWRWTRRSSRHSGIVPMYPQDARATQVRRDAGFRHTPQAGISVRAMCLT